MSRVQVPREIEGGAEPGDRGGCRSRWWGDGIENGTRPMPAGAFGVRRAGGLRWVPGPDGGSGSGARWRGRGRCDAIEKAATFDAIEKTLNPKP